jgi:hypothetical protein
MRENELEGEEEEDGESGESSSEVLGFGLRVASSTGSWAETIRIRHDASTQTTVGLPGSCFCSTKLHELLHWCLVPR